MYLAPSMSTVAKILVIRYSSMGDIVLTTPVYRLLKEQFNGEVEIHVLTKSAFAFLLKQNPRIEKVWEVKKSGMEIIDGLKAEKFDYILDLQNSVRSRSVRKKLGVLSFKVNKLNIRKWIQVNLGLWKGPLQHIVERYCNTLSWFKLKYDGKGLEYYFNTNTRTIEEMLPSEFIVNGYVVFAVGGAHEGKRWSPENWIELVNQTDKNVVLIGGKEDVLNIPSTSRVLNLIGACSVDESARMVQHTKGIVCGDTGMMHIAAALGANIISMWGCTTPELGMSAIRPTSTNHPWKSITLQPANRNKRPCSKLGNTCKYGMDHKCIDVIKVDDVQKALVHL
jgi:ADP-heptose:LPS heptosyltransferase